MRESIEGVAGLDAKPGGGRDAAVMRFVERFALTFSEAGVPRMPSRVFVAILASEEGRLTAAELAEMLQVSPAAVSNAVRYLQQVRIVERVREPGERRDHYRVFSDTWYENVMRRDELLVRWQADLREGIEAVGADTPAGKRLEENRRFYEFLHEELPRVMEKWRGIRAGSDADEAG